jgi:hypothetical protein
LMHLHLIESPLLLLSLCRNTCRYFFYDFDHFLIQKIMQVQFI